MSAPKYSEGRMRACPPSIGRFKLAVVRPHSGALKIIGEVSNYNEEAIEDLRRIVACWNACLQMPTEDIEELAAIDLGVMRLIVLADDYRVQRDDLLTALKKMNRAYVNLMEIGRDRILMLGGKCDPVDMMESSDTHLRESKAAIAEAQGGAT